MDTEYKILIFSWNTQSVRLYESLDDDEIEYNRSGLGLQWPYHCEKADFFPRLAEQITEKDPDIVAIGFQEDAEPGSYFHSHLLPEEMPKLGYNLVKRAKLIGVGKVTYDSAWDLDIRLRGLRLSVYAKPQLAGAMLITEQDMRYQLGNNGQSSYVCTSNITRSKGAICAYLMIPNRGTIAIINSHLPFNSRSLITSRRQNNYMLRQNELCHSNLCFNNIYENLVLYPPMRDKPVHVIYFGDLNYRLSDERDSTIVCEELLKNSNNKEYLEKLYRDHDELLQQMEKGNIYKFQEGVDNRGPNFIPTCKMNKERISTEFRENIDSIIDDLGDNSDGISDVCFKLGRYNQRVPSYTDRILYTRVDTRPDKYHLKCSYYDRFDHGECMKKSDHAAVLALLTLSPNENVLPSR